MGASLGDDMPSLPGNIPLWYLSPLWYSDSALTLEARRDVIAYLLATHFMAD
jgi:hypothetical protein